MTDLRAFLRLVQDKRKRDIVHVSRQVDPAFETSAIVTKLADQQRSPIFVFEDVKGCTLPLVTNVGGSMGRLAMALDCPLRDVGAKFEAAARNPIPPVSVEDAPVHAHVREGDDADLTWLPALRYHADDAPQPYLTAALVVARDLQTGVQNLSFHRMMVLDRRRTGIYMEPGRHLHGIFETYVAHGEAMPIAVIIGVHPAVALGALYAGPAGVDEYDVIGGLLGQGLPVTTTAAGLQVPAGAEIVLEGTVDPTARTPEGPFGEFTGYGTGAITTPVFTVDRITHRDDPYFVDIVSGGLEHLLLSVPALEHRTRRDAAKAGPEVVDISLPAPLTAIVSIRKRDDEDPKRVIDALLSGDIYAKQVIVVDHDVDPGDLSAVMSAMALQCQPDRQVHVLSGVRCTPLDPSCPSEDGMGAKIGIDATRALSPARAVTRNRIPAAVYDAVDVDEILGKR